MGTGFSVIIWNCWDQQGLLPKVCESLCRMWQLGNAHAGVNIDGERRFNGFSVLH